MITLTLSSKETKEPLTKELALGHFKKRFCSSDFGTGLVIPFPTTTYLVFIRFFTLSKKEIRFT